MTDVVDAGSFVGKWHARWPEWAIAQVFVAPAQRPLAEAWFALLQEFTDAAWGGSDPTPGLAKLAWWQEELQGWARGARRHPLATVLQRHAAPWSLLGGSLLALQRSREPAATANAAVAAVLPFADAVSQCEAVLLGAPPVDPQALASVLLGTRLLSDPDAALPRQAMEAGQGVAVLPPWIAALLDTWPRRAARPRAVALGLLRARLQQLASGGGNAPLAPWRALAASWRAARKG